MPIFAQDDQELDPLTSRKMYYDEPFDTVQQRQRFALFVIVSAFITSQDVDADMQTSVAGNGHISRAGTPLPGLFSIVKAAGFILNYAGIAHRHHTGALKTKYESFDATEYVRFRNSLRQDLLKKRV